MVEKKSRKANESEHKEIETTGHSWDGIEEYNNPLPRWWLWTFYLTIIWGIGLTVLRPAWPGLTSATPGTSNWSTRADVAKSIEAHEAQNADLVKQLVEVKMTDLPQNDELNSYAVSRGRSVFLANCSQCHGAGAAGAVAYPNLLDNDWLWYGSIDEITETIRHGIRQSDDEATRFSEMPDFGGMLSKEDIVAVADHVLSLSGKGESSEQGAQIFTDNCASCHGADGNGDHAQGAPNLTDAVWLFGDTKEDIIRQVTASRNGDMPAWTNRLSEADIRSVAAYVHQLGGGE